MAFDCYIKFTNPDIQGESTRKGYDKQIELEDFEFSAENSVSIGSQSGGAGAGRATLGAVMITKKTDCSSPLLFQFCCDGVHFNSVVITMLKASGDAKALAFLQYTFNVVFLKKVEWCAGQKIGDTPVEKVTFAYAKLTVTYTPQAVTGGAAPKAVMGAWSAYSDLS